MADAALETLREANRLLREALVRFRPERRRYAHIAPQELSALLDELLKASESLRLAPGAEATSEAVAHELHEYRKNLQELKRFLPALHVGLLVERSRLETERSHIRAATAWAGANRKTL
jgi:hypothetical protein